MGFDRITGGGGCKIWGNTKKTDVIRHLGWDHQAEALPSLLPFTLSGPACDHKRRGCGAPHQMYTNQFRKKEREVVSMQHRDPQRGGNWEHSCKCSPGKGALGPRRAAGPGEDWSWLQPVMLYLWDQGKKSGFCSPRNSGLCHTWVSLAGGLLAVSSSWEQNPSKFANKSGF